ncbi:MAG: hypothetical protein ABL967_15895 [Bryobacteraceae bacterium]
MTRETLQQKVDAFCAEWPEVLGQIESSESSCNQLVAELRDLKAEIAGLVESRRCASRNEKGYYRDRIRDTRDAKDTVTLRLRESQTSLAQARARGANLKRSEKDLRQILSAEIRRAVSGAERLAASSPSLGGTGIGGLSQKVREHYESLHQFVYHVDKAVGKSNSEEFRYLPEPPEPTFWPTSDSVERPLVLVEPPRFESYLTQDGKNTVPCEAYSVYDTHDVQSLSQELRGVAYADSYLRCQGHEVVLPIGGSGALDMLSLDKAGRLWVTEVKETETARNIAASGLDRQLSSASGSPVTLYENEPSWLLRETPKFSAVDSVLGTLKSTIEAESDLGRKEGYRRLRDAYVEAARQGFTQLSTNKSLIQVGFTEQTGELKPPQAIRSQKLDTMIERVEPNNVVQIEVVVGSKDSPMAGELQPAPVDHQAPGTASAEPEA